ncbi:MAG: prepilin-type N-terminal cleavage/methylation domain-containing protein [Acidobacteria bacterium]|nr:prepilin-type N-terminal cleavage/methylation domain-containing protein [Acidobacteriota bacterium]MBI3470709.1 prepilin-type N-terminal cleavage/methylation domain-containing protein [Candidatus Solibacter usitatus]
MTTDRNPRRGFSLIELLIVIAIILIIAAMAMPRLGKARMQAFETGALRAITTIHTAQTQYYSQFGRYATTLAELGPPASGPANQNGADLISGDLAAGEKSGYKFILQATPTGYTLNGNPVAFGNTGSRTFYSDQSLTIRHNYSNEPATAQSPEIK